MRVLLNTLYLGAEGYYVSLDNDTLRIELERETRLRVPLHHLLSVVVFGDAMLTPAVFRALADAGKTVVFCDRQGRFHARLEGPVQGNVLLRQAQFRRRESAAFTLDTARAFVAGKLRNTRQALLRAAREAREAADASPLSAAADGLAASLRALPFATTLDEIRGLEGEAARRYFGVFGHLLKPDASVRAAFTLSGRSRRPPLDAANALLSFLYSLLMNDCRSACEAAGLDPQVGFLHTLRPGRAALALDLMEEFRAHIADRVALTLVNRGQVSATDFETRPGGAVLMKDDTRKLVVTAYQERKQEEIQHPLTEQKGPLGLMPFIQARLLARLIRGDGGESEPGSGAGTGAGETGAGVGYLPFLVR